MSESSKQRSVASNYIQALLDRGIEYVFANAGTDFAPIIEALVDAKKEGRPTPEFILVPHENVAVSMAHGYFMTTGKTAAVMVHVTVGTANALCGLMNASRDCAPILLTAGGTPSTESGHIGSRNASIHWGQDSFDQGGMVREYVKWDYELRPGQAPEEIVGRALDIAMTEPRGPVYLALPREVLGDVTDKPVKLPKQRESGALRSVPSSKGIKQTAEYIANAKLPLIITSALGRDHGNVAKLTRICEKFGVAVALPGEPGGRELNIATTNPMFIGVHPTDIIAKADVIISIDCEVPWWPSKVSPNEDAKLVHISADPFFANYPVRGFEMDLAISGSSSIALCKLEEALDELNADSSKLTESRIESISALGNARLEQQQALVQSVENNLPIHSAWIAQCLNEVITDNTIIVNEMGVPLEMLALKEPGSYLSSSLAGGLGFGLGASIGAKLGAPDKQVILLVGDGSYMFGCPTATHHAASLRKLPTTTVVMNNARWNAVHRSTLGMYPDGLASKEEVMPLVSLGDSPEYDQIMHACGGFGIKVEQPNQLKAALEKCLEANANGQAALINLVCGE